MDNLSLFCSFQENVKSVLVLCTQQIHSNLSAYLSDWQQGFVKGRSTATQLILTHNKWARALDEGHQVDVAFFDFSKGFDRVPHQTLLHKLCNFRISGKLLNWCQDYLSTRRQRVVINGSSSSLTEITSGVPQDSILAPLDVNINILGAQTCNYAQQFLDCLQSYALNSLPSNKPLGLYSLPVRILIGACQILWKPLLILLIKYNLVISVTTATQTLLTPICFLINTSKSAFFSKITIFHSSATNNNISQPLCL